MQVYSTSPIQRDQGFSSSCKATHNEVRYKAVHKYLSTTRNECNVRSDCAIKDRLLLARVAIEKKKKKKKNSALCRSIPNNNLWWWKLSQKVFKVCLVIAGFLSTKVYTACLTCFKGFSWSISNWFIWICDFSQSECFPGHWNKESLAGKVFSSRVEW